MHLQDLKPICVTAEPLTLKQSFNSLSLFTLLAHKPWAIWLDSGESSHVDARYDIMVWDPIVTLSTQNESTLVQDHREDSSPDKTYSECPLEVLKQVQKEVFSNIQCPSITLPFNGGALGYFGYDLGRTLEVLPNIAKKDIHLPDMAIGLYLQAIIYDREANSYTLLCPKNERQNISRELNSLLSNSLANKAVDTSFCLSTDWQSNMDKQAYEEKFNQVQTYLLSGDSYQVNLAQRFSAQYQGCEFTAYKKLRTANQSPFSAFMRFEHQTILSVSPERFLQLQEGVVQSKPIKGTSIRSKVASIDQENAQRLFNSEKDRAENLMIVDLLRNDISKTCQAGTVIVPKLFDIESFAAVHHLVSTVEGKLLPNATATDLLKGAFPGGSITGAPKIRAMEIIEELEPHRRSLYCGSIGYISACGNMDTSITIRTLICEGNSIHCWAGGGLVADSNVDSEYQETLDKVNKILPTLAS